MWKAICERASSWKNGFLVWCFGVGLCWSLISKFMKTRISQSAAAIPIVGYALLWSEEIRRYMELQVLLKGGLWFSVTGRLILLYFGAILLTVAWLVYARWCPRMIKKMTDAEDYLFYELQTHNEVEFKRICVLVRGYLETVSDGPKRWLPNFAPPTLADILSAQSVHQAISSIPQYPKPEYKSQVLLAWYLANEGKAFWAQVCACFCVIVGGLFIALPSLEVFFSVILRVVLPFLGLSR